MPICEGCRFRLYASQHRFHCAADVYGWAYLADDRMDITMPIECNKRIPGDPLRFDRELKSTEFWRVSGERIRPEDWETWTNVKNSRLPR